MAKNNASAFDEILSSFPEEDDRKTFQNLAERNPALKEYGLRQADYSRRMGEIKGQLDELNDWKAWKEANWDSEKELTNREVETLSRMAELEKEKQELEGRIEAGGEVASFSDVDKWLEEATTKRGFVTQKVIDDKEAAVTKYVRDTHASLAELNMEYTYVNSKHIKEFGEPLDPRDFMDKLTAAKAFGDVRGFYENMVSPRRQDAVKKSFEDELAKAKTEAEAAVVKAREEATADARREIAMGVNGQTPVDLGGKQMGSFQKNYLKLNKEQGPAIPESAVVGEGTLSAVAARKFTEEGHL